MTAPFKPGLPVVEPVGDALKFVWISHSLAVDVERITDKRDETWAELTFYAIQEDRPPQFLMGPRRLNLLATRSVTELANILAAQVTLSVPQVDKEQWKQDCHDMLDQLARETLRRQRLGQPPMPLNSFVTPDGPVPYMIAPIVPDHAPTVLVSEGGGGKSTLALALAVSVATGIPLPGMSLPDDLAVDASVLYLDWETTGATHHRRLRQICRGLGLNETPDLIDYIHPEQTIDQATWLRKLIAEHRYDLVIVDSIGYAVGGDLKEAGVATNLFRAVNSWDTSVLLTHHENREGGFYGSVYFLNSARSLWTMTSARQPHGLDLSLKHEKMNDGALYYGNFGLKMTYADNMVKFHGQSVESSPALAAKLPLPDRIARLLEDHGAMSYRDLADELDVSIPVIKKHVGNNLHRFARFVQPGTTRSVQIGLRAAQDEPDALDSKVVEFRPAHAPTDDGPDVPF